VPNDPSIQIRVTNNFETVSYFSGRATSLIHSSVINNLLNLSLNMLVLIKLMLFLSVSGPQTCSDLVSFVGFAAYCHRVQPCSRKTHSTNYHSIKR